jgi:hypothetical protein
MQINNLLIVPLCQRGKIISTLPNINRFEGNDGLKCDEYRHWSKFAQFSYNKFFQARQSPSIELI